MHVGSLYTLCLACALAVCTARAADTPIPQASEWEGPLVEVTMKDAGATRQTGYLMSYQGGHMLFRPLGKDTSDVEFTSGEIDGLRFLAAPPKPPAVEAKTPSSEPEKKTEARLDPKTDPKSDSKTDQGMDRPFAGMKVREKLEKMRELIDPPALDKLAPRDRERYRELTVRHPGKHSPEETQELNALRGKMDLPPVETYRMARSEAYKARTAEQADAYLEEKRKALAASKSAEEARKNLIGIMYGLKSQEDSAEEYFASLNQNLSNEVVRIKNNEVRATVRATLHELITDFVAQNLRYEKDREDRPLLRPGLRKTE